MDYAIHILTLVSIFSISVLSLNLLVGETGLLSVGHAALYGIGAYGTTLIMLHFGVNFFLAALLAAFISGTVAAFIGAVFLPLKEIFYVLGTVGFNMIVWAAMLNWDSLTRGPLGIPGIMRPSLFGMSFENNGAFFVLCLMVLCAVYAAHHAVVKSNFGRVLHAIREDEEVATVLGYSTNMYKILVFAISATLAAFAGSLYASYISYINPSTFTVNDSVVIFSMVVLGGLGSAPGAILGTLLLTALPEALRFVGFSAEIAGQMRQFSYGAILILLMLYRPRGILGRFRI